MERIKVAILTASDAGAASLREDVSGVTIARMVKEAHMDVCETHLLADEQQQLANTMAEICDSQRVDLLLTTGGTGFSLRDCMPEATKQILEKEVPGIPEAMRMYSMQFTKRAMLSRACAGIRKQTLIVNLPGSPKAVEECLEFILSELEHAIGILKGSIQNCARGDQK